MRETIASVFRGLFSIVLPRRCRICGVRDPEGGLPWCPGCAGAGFFGPSTDECRFAHLDGMAYAGLYDGPWEAEIRAFKFGRESRLARPIAELLTLQLKTFFDSWGSKCWSIAAIPSGHGSSEALAASLSKCLEYDFVPEVIARIDGPRQRDLSLTERLRNADRVLVAGAPVRFDGVGVILVDDVATTLATLRRGACIVREKRAAFVVGAVGARTPRQ